MSGSLRGGETKSSLTSGLADMMSSAHRITFSAAVVALMVAMSGFEVYVDDEASSGAYNPLPAL